MVLPGTKSDVRAHRAREEIGHLHTMPTRRLSRSRCDVTVVPTVKQHGCHPLAHRRPVEQTQEGRFTRPARANQCEHRAVLHLHADIVHQHLPTTARERFLVSIAMAGSECVAEPDLMISESISTSIP